jgi:hypothetical protein
MISTIGIGMNGVQKEIAARLEQDQYAINRFKKLRDLAKRKKTFGGKLWLKLSLN